MFLLIIVGISIVILFIWLQRQSTELEKEEAEKAKHETWKQEFEAREEAYRTAQSEALVEMEAKWGNCTKDIFVDHSSIFTLKDRLYVFEEVGKIILGGNEYDFKDIIGFSMVNNSKTVYNAYTTGSSSKDVGGMIGRGVIGKMIGGDMGAAIGAMSADDEYEYNTEYDSEVENDYKIYVNVDSISSPTVVLNIGSDEDGAFEIANLLNVIIKRNNIQG